MFCSLNSKGDIVFVNNEEGCIQKIDPADRTKEAKVYVAGSKKSMVIYKDYVILIHAGATITTSSKVYLSIFDIDVEYIAYEYPQGSNVKAIIPANDSVFLILEN